jgi:hypothetical protein
MRRRARTDLSGGRSVMSVPTGSLEGQFIANFPMVHHPTLTCERAVG